jgi:hypothetical protein
MMILQAPSSTRISYYMIRVIISDDVTSHWQGPGAGSGLPVSRRPAGNRGHHDSDDHDHGPAAPASRRR